MATRRELQRLLLLLVRVDTSESELRRALQDVDPALVVQNAIAHRVPGLVYQRLVDADLLQYGEFAELEEKRRSAVAKHLVALNLVSIVSATIRAPWLVLKGPALARLYDRPDSRSYTDLDILVSRSSFVSILEDLSAEGFELLNKNWTGFVADGVAEVPLDGGAMVIDLHWSVLPLRDHRESLSFSTDEALSRRGHVACDSGSFPCLSPEDSLLHLCLHGGLSGGRRLVWLVDIDRTVRSLDIDWDVFVRRAHDSGAGLMSFLLLRLVKEALNSPIPRSAMNSLRKGRVWTVADHLARRLPRSPGRLSTSWDSGIFLSASRDSLAMSTRALRDELTRAWQTNRRDERVLDWRTDSGGASGQQQWIDYVQSERT